MPSKEKFTPPDIILVVRERDPDRAQEDERWNRETVEGILSTQGIVNLRLEMRVYADGSYQPLRRGSLIVKCKSQKALELVLAELMGVLEGLSGKVVEA